MIQFRVFVDVSQGLGSNRYGSLRIEIKKIRHGHGLEVTERA